MHIWMSSLRDLLRGEVRSGLPRRSLVAASAVGGDWSRHARRADPSPTPMRSELPLRLYLFGPLRAFIDSEVAIDEHFARRKAKALLALLIRADSNRRCWFYDAHSKEEARVEQVGST